MSENSRSSVHGFSVPLFLLGSVISCRPNNLWIFVL